MLRHLVGPAVATRLGLLEPEDAATAIIQNDDKYLTGDMA
jgi:hypothetical protein